MKQNYVYKMWLSADNKLLPKIIFQNTQSLAFSSLPP